MKLVHASLVMITLFFGLHVEQGSAHVLLADQNVGAIVHIEPNDSPVAGRQSQLTFYFEDITNRFSLSQCQCHIRILKTDTHEKQEIISEKLYAVSQLESSNSYTFSEPGEYSVEITGRPLDDKDRFQDFSFSYNLRVITDGIESQTVTPLLLFGLAGIMGLIMLGALQGVED